MKKTSTKMEELLAQPVFQIPKVADLVEGKVISIAHNEVLMDIGGYLTGVIRGPELFDESSEYSNLKVGDMAQATVLEAENEQGHMELSFRFAGHQKAWDKLDRLKKEGDIIEAHILEANKGGLIVRLDKISGFLPVSQLTPEHYPRVEGGDRNKILEHLNQFLGQIFRVKVIDVVESEEKLIVWEGAGWEEKQKDIIASYKVGDKVKGRVTGVVDFGAFVEFGDGLEGLVHISELAWQRIDNPRDIIRVGQEVEAAIISIDGSKISLSMKKLIEDPWTNVKDKYQIGQLVKGQVLKANPFGAFVELDRDIHGLAHISELSDKMITNPTDVVQVGEMYTFKILSIEPHNHRLGLSLKGAKKGSAEKKKETARQEESSLEEAPQEKTVKEEAPKEEAEIGRASCRERV